MRYPFSANHHPGNDLIVTQRVWHRCDRATVRIHEHDLGPDETALRIGLKISHLAREAVGKRDVVAVHPRDKRAGCLLQSLI